MKERNLRDVRLQRLLHRERPESPHGRDYPVNWNVNFDESRHKDGSYYSFTRCPTCEFCNRERIAAQSICLDGDIGEIAAELR